MTHSTPLFPFRKQVPCWKNHQEGQISGPRHKYVSQESLADCWNQIGQEPGLDDVGGSPGNECCANIGRFLIDGDKYYLGSTISCRSPK
jgi:hypothetical protein